MMKRFFNIYKDNNYIKINLLFFKLTIKNNKYIIKKLENEINNYKERNYSILKEIKEFVSKYNLHTNKIIFFDTDIEISKYIINYFPNSKIIKGDFHFNILNNNINDIIDILTAKIIVTSSESSIFNYLFEDQILINIWHASGAFKRFGKHSKSYNNTKVNKNHYVITSSEKIIPFYAEAFELPKDNIIPLGQIRTDIFFNKIYLEELKKNFFNKYPNLRNKKIYLYVPTFREKNNNIISFFNFDLFKLSRLMNKDEVFLYKLHPAVINIIDSNNTNTITNLKEINNNILDMSNEDIMSLLVVSDVILTDYSSAFMEGLLLNKPCVFTSNDIDEYERGFYINYRKDLPGEIVESNKAKTLLTSLRKASINHKNYEKFKEYHLGSCDGHSIERVVNFIKTSIDNN